MIYINQQKVRVLNDFFQRNSAGKPRLLAIICSLIFLVAGCDSQSNDRSSASQKKIKEVVELEDIVLLRSVADKSSTFNMQLDEYVEGKTYQIVHDGKIISEQESLEHYVKNAFSYIGIPLLAPKVISANHGETVVENLVVYSCLNLSCREFKFKIKHITTNNSETLLSSPVNSFREVDLAQHINLDTKGLGVEPSSVVSITSLGEHLPFEATRSNTEHHLVFSTSSKISQSVCELDLKEINLNIRHCNPLCITLNILSPASCSTAEKTTLENNDKLILVNSENELNIQYEINVPANATVASSHYAGDIELKALTPTKVKDSATSNVIWQMKIPKSAFQHFTDRKAGSIVTIWCENTNFQCHEFVLPVSLQINYERPPIVAIEQTNYTINTSDKLVIDASGSYDPDGNNVAFHWLIKSKPIHSNIRIEQQSALEMLSLSDLEKGEYVISLTVSDGTLNSVEQLVRISVLNRPPTKTEIGFSNNVIYSNTDVQLSYQSPHDPDGDTITEKISWFINSELVTDINSYTLPFNYFSKGDKIAAILSISDGEAEQTYRVSSTVSNSPPTINQKLPDVLTHATLSIFDPLFIDSDNDELDIELLYGPPGLSIDRNVLTYKTISPMMTESRKESFGLAVSDGESFAVFEKEVELQFSKNVHPNSFINRIDIPYSADTYTQTLIDKSRIKENSFQLTQIGQRNTVTYQFERDIEEWKKPWEPLDLALIVDNVENTYLKFKFEELADEDSSITLTRDGRLIDSFQTNNSAPIDTAYGINICNAAALPVASSTANNFIAIAYEKLNDSGEAGYWLTLIDSFSVQNQLKFLASSSQVCHFQIANVDNDELMEIVYLDGNRMVSLSSNGRSSTSNFPYENFKLFDFNNDGAKEAYIIQQSANQTIKLTTFNFTTHYTQTFETPLKWYNNQQLIGITRSPAEGNNTMVFARLDPKLPNRQSIVTANLGADSSSYKTIASVALDENLQLIASPSGESNYMLIENHSKVLDIFRGSIIPLTHSNSLTSEKQHNCVTDECASEASTAKKESPDFDYRNSVSENEGCESALIDQLPSGYGNSIDSHNIDSDPHHEFISVEYDKILFIDIDQDCNISANPLPPTMNILSHDYLLGKFKNSSLTQPETQNSYILSLSMNSDDEPQQFHVIELPSMKTVKSYTWAGKPIDKLYRQSVHKENESQGQIYAISNTVTRGKSGYGKSSTIRLINPFVGKTIWESPQLPGHIESFIDDDTYDIGYLHEAIQMQELNIKTSEAILEIR